MNSFNLSSIIFCILLLFCGVADAQQKRYYMSASGDDNNDGHTQTSAWRTVDKINATNFHAGDSIFFEAGSTFDGTIRLSSDDNGNAEMPVVFTSFGKGKATINAEKKDGLFAINSSYIKISGLAFKGSGVEENEGSGIHFFSSDSINAPGHISINDCDVSGFKSYGIVFGCSNNLSVNGYSNVRITHCNVTENGSSGISSYGSQLGFQHHDFYIARCKAYRNRGIPSQTEGHSGNGIMMAQVYSLLIEHCEAFENGSNNRCTAGGPVGIWVWMCKNAIIQYCSSHNNYAGLTKDGGGFDIDGGASNCILQYNYSYNNEGAGYLLAEFGALHPFTNNIIRFNVSVNDGRKNSYGAITVWGVSQDFKVTNTQVYNNTIYLDDKNIVEGIPAAVNFLGAHFKNVIIANNIFVTKGRVNFVNSDTIISPATSLLLHNNYYSYNKHYSFQWGKNRFTSLEEWLKNAPQQERIDGKKAALCIDPLFMNTSSKENVSARLIPGALSLQKNSPLRKHKLQLTDYFEIFSNTADYCNHDLSEDGFAMPGACIK